jgi:hypothetical protein
MTRTAQGDRQAELVDHWLRRQPEAFRLFRDSAGEVAGFVARLSLHLAQPEDLAADPVSQRCDAMRSSIILPGRESRCWPGASWSTAILTSDIPACQAPCSGSGISATSCFGHRLLGTSSPTTAISSQLQRSRVLAAVLQPLGLRAPARGRLSDRLHALCDFRARLAPRWGGGLAGAYRGA